MFPTDFPKGIPKAYAFDFDGTINKQGSLYETQLILYARAKTPDEAEDLILNLISKFSNLTNETIGDNSVILIKPVGKHAEYKGTDESNRYYFSSRFRILID